MCVSVPSGHGKLPRLVPIFFIYRLKRLLAPAQQDSQAHHRHRIDCKCKCRKASKTAFKISITTLPLDEAARVLKELLIASPGQAYWFTCLTNHSVFRICVPSGVPRPVQASHPECAL